MHPVLVQGTYVGECHVNGWGSCWGARRVSFLPKEAKKAIAEGRGAVILNCPPVTLPGEHKKENGQRSFRFVIKRQGRYYTRLTCHNE